MLFNKKTKLRQRPNSSKPNTTFSYYSSRNFNPNEPRQKVISLPNKRLNLLGKSWLRTMPSVVAAFALVICLFYVLSLNTNPKIVQINGRGSVFLHNQNTYQSKAHKLFTSSILNGNKITVNVSGITETFKQEFPELSNVSITLPLFGHRPIIYITPSLPTLIISEVTGSFVLNENGIAVISANGSQGISDLNLPTITDQTNLNVGLGQDVLPKSNVDFVRSMMDQLRAAHKTITSLTLPAKANELDIKFNNSSYFIKFDLAGNAREQVGSLLATLDYLKAKNITPSTYIDVRIEGRIYYK